MNKKWLSLLSMILLVALCVPSAFAAPHPSQMGDPGGATASQYGGTGTKSPIQNNAPETTQPQTVQDVPAQTQEGSYTTLPQTEGTTQQQTTPETTTSGGTQTLDWYSVGYDLINKYKNIKIYDINAGISWSATYINGKNHADIIPASQADAEKLEKNNITGSYVRRPVLVTINGTQYAGSMYAVGHGETSYCKYFKGVMCIHFTGSQTHGSKKVDSDHQSAIQDALTYGN